MTAEPPEGPLAAALDTVETRSEHDADQLRRLRTLADGPAPWDRSEPLHLTGSALVVHPPRERVLLRWHARQQNWLQVGGHADPGEVDPLAVALREAEEETGLTDLRPWPEADHPALLHAVIVPVPANEKEPPHEHGDLRFVLATDRPEDARPEDDVAELRWLSVPEALDLTGEDNVAELIRLVGELFGANR